MGRAALLVLGRRCFRQRCALGLRGLVGWAGWAGCAHLVPSGCPTQPLLEQSAQTGRRKLARARLGAEADLDSAMIPEGGRRGGEPASPLIAMGRAMRVL
jgi:hypothetical protein